VQSKAYEVLLMKSDKSNRQAREKARIIVPLFDEQNAVRQTCY